MVHRERKREPRDAAVQHTQRVVRSRYVKIFHRVSNANVDRGLRNRRRVYVRSFSCGSLSMLLAHLSLSLSLSPRVPSSADREAKNHVLRKYIPSSASKYCVNFLNKNLYLIVL